MNIDGVFDYQAVAAHQLLAALKKYRAALDASDMGVGKTFNAGCVMRALDLPSLVVCPKVSIPGWEKMGGILGTEFDSLNYEMVRTGRSMFGEWRDGLDGKPQFHWADGLGLIVFDEAHRCTSLDDTLQVKMMIAARRQNIPTIALSASIATTPLNFRALGYLLDLHGLYDWNDWARGYGVLWDAENGYHFTPDPVERDAHMLALNKLLFPQRGCRVKIADLGNAFPDVQITAELVDIDEPSRMNQLYAEMGPALAALKAGRGWTSEERAFITWAWQETEVLMVPVYAEMARDAVASGRSVAIFVNFRATLAELSRVLKCDCVIHGGQRGVRGERERRRNLAEFMADRERIILSTTAGAESIDMHDTHGNFPRLGIGALGWSAVKVRQTTGRLRRSGGKSKAVYRFPLARGTVQQSIYNNVVPKLNQLDLLNDGDLIPGGNIPIAFDLDEGKVDNFPDMS